MTKMRNFDFENGSTAATFANRKFIRLAALLLYFEKKATPFDSASEIALTDVKCITKQQYSSDLWPLKIKRNWSNCIIIYLKNSWFLIG